MQNAMQRWHSFRLWLEANNEALLTGTLVALALIAVMLVLQAGMVRFAHDASGVDRYLLG